MAEPGPEGLDDDDDELEDEPDGAVDRRDPFDTDDAEELRARLERLREPEHAPLEPAAERALGRRIQASWRRALGLALSTHAGLLRLLDWLEGAGRADDPGLFFALRVDGDDDEARAAALTRLRAEAAGLVPDLRATCEAARAAAPDLAIRARAVAVRAVLRRVQPVARRARLAVAELRRELDWLELEDDPLVLRGLEDDLGEPRDRLLRRRAMLERALAAWERDRLRLARSVQGLAVHVARQAEGRGLPLWFLIDVAALGALLAAGKFEAQRGYRFHTYAFHWMEKACAEAVEDGLPGPYPHERLVDGGTLTLLPPLVLGDVGLLGAWSGQQPPPSRPGRSDVVLVGRDGRTAGRRLGLDGLTPPALHDVEEHGVERLQADVARLVAERGWDVRVEPLPRPVPHALRALRAAVDGHARTAYVEGRRVAVLRFPSGSSFAIRGEEPDAEGRWRRVVLRRREADPAEVLRPERTQARVDLSPRAVLGVASWFDLDPAVRDANQGWPRLELSPAPTWTVELLVGGARDEVHEVQLVPAEE